MLKNESLWDQRWSIKLNDAAAKEEFASLSVWAQELEAKMTNLNRQAMVCIVLILVMKKRRKKQIRFFAEPIKIWQNHRMNTKYKD